MTPPNGICGSSCHGRVVEIDLLVVIGGWASSTAVGASWLNTAAESPYSIERVTGLVDDAVGKGASGASANVRRSRSSPNCAASPFRSCPASVRSDERGRLAARLR